MYTKYTTDAIVLAQYNYGEHDKIFTLYTRDFGLIRARAIAVRKMESRQRYALILFTPVSISLVRGVRGWRITGARPIPYLELSRDGVHTYARITQLVMRLVQGEEPNTYLFEVLRGAREACAVPHALALASTELLCVARILFTLGYLSPQALTAAPARNATHNVAGVPARNATHNVAGGLFTHAQYEKKDLHTVEDTKKDMLSTVNRALEETQL
jgi:hypothetical protein